MIRMTLLDTGFCRVPEAQMLQGGANQVLDCHAIVALLEHPTHGHLLFDAGYAPRMLSETRRFPFRLYRWMTPLRLRDELAVVAQLPRHGLRAHDIRTIIVSHFHADHVGGLMDFPEARFVASLAAYLDIAEVDGFAALRKGVIPNLLPRDFAARATLVDAFSGPLLPALGPTHDLLGDGSILLMNLPGHARGQIGALVETTEGPVLLAADGAWHSRAIRERRPPGAVTALIVDDYDTVAETLTRLNGFSAVRPHVRIIPTHCPEIFTEVFGS